MIDRERAKLNLDIIKKYGDLYSTIIAKSGVKPNGWKSFLNANILFFSRILYAATWLFTKIKNKLIPVKKVKNAQDDIRDIVGCNIDIIMPIAYVLSVPDYINYVIKKYILHNKTNMREKTAVLYAEDGLNLSDYLNNLKNIYEFCSMMKINTILLRWNDIKSLAENFDTEEIDSFYLSTIINACMGKFNFRANMEYEKLLSQEYLSLNLEQLQTLISKLEGMQYDKNVIFDLGNYIEDKVIKNALERFKDTDNLEDLICVVRSRLNLFLNDDAVFKSRSYGKVTTTITLKDKYVKVVTKNSLGDIISDTVMTLYDYLEILNFDNILRAIKHKSDNKEILAISALYLYLSGQDFKVDKMKTESLSFFDKIYEEYQSKLNNRFFKMKGVYSKLYKWYIDFLNTYLLCLGSLGLFMLGFLLIFIINSSEATDKNSKLNSILDRIFYAYEDSYEFEKDLVAAFLDFNENDKGFFQGISSEAGDSFVNHKPNVIASIQYDEILPNYLKPDYFACSYADMATYADGKIIYNLIESQIDFEEINEGFHLFDITFRVSRKKLKTLISDNKLNIPQILYPVGQDYIITGIKIVDLNASNNSVIIDYDRANLSGNTLTEQELELLKKMREPIITISYGIDYIHTNSFVNDIKRDSYSDIPSLELRTIITNNLGLSNDATLDEIYNVIKAKKYSKTPFHDAGLTQELKNMDEREYFKNVASLDSLICNLAATLMVNTDENLVYVVGFSGNGSCIKQNKAHAWTMTQDGEIVDATPYGGLIGPENNNYNNDELVVWDVDSESKEMIRNVLNWGINNNIRFYVLLVLISILGKKLFGKKIVMKMNIAKVDDLFNKPHVSEAYAKVKEILYGGINIPINYSSEELVDVITKEFAGFSKDELKDLLSQLNSMKKINRYYNLSSKIAKEIPFVLENSQELRRALVKRAEDRKKDE